MNYYSHGVAIRRESLLDLRRAATSESMKSKAALRQLSKGNFKLTLSLLKQLLPQPPPSPLHAFVAARQYELKEKDVDGRRCAALKMVDRQLSKGNFKLALSLVKQLQSQPPPSRLHGFAAARQVPRRISSLKELNISVEETSALQTLLDSILDTIKCSLRSSQLEEVSLFRVDASSTGEDYDFHLEDDIIEHKQVAYHEAGHFLVGYLLGVLPKKYTIYNMEDEKHDENADASVQFIGFDFLTEVEDVILSKKGFNKVKPGHQANKLKLSSTVLCRFLCVILGGLVAEHLVFGYSKGHHRDVEKLEGVLKWLEFTEDEANTLIKWAALNTLVILHRHGEATSALADAMSQGRSIGKCIATIENTLNHDDI